MDSDCSIPYWRQFQAEWQIGCGSVCEPFLTSPFSLAAVEVQELKLKNTRDEYSFVGPMLAATPLSGSV